MSEPGKKQTSDKKEVSSGAGERPPLVFISHDSRDSELAESFGKLLTDVSAGALKSFSSSDKKGAQGIEYGTEWYPELIRKLEAASDVVCLLTQRSINRPWILYEAGVAKGSLRTPVHGLALGIPLSVANTGPFAQFQNSDDTLDSVTSLVIQLLKRLPWAEPSRKAVELQVGEFKKRATDLLQVISSEASDPGVSTGAAVEDSSPAQFFEEIKLMFRRLEYVSRPARRGKIRRAFEIEELERLAKGVTRDPMKPAGIAVLVSVLRDEAPWLYDLGMSIFHASLAEDVEAVDTNLQLFDQATELTLSGSLMSRARGWRSQHYSGMRRISELVQDFALDFMSKELERKKEKLGK